MLKEMIRFLELKIPPVLLVMLTMLFMFFSSKVELFSVDAGTYGMVVSVMFLVAGAVFSILGVVEFRRARTTVIKPGKSSSLVDSGVYRVTRNPMYVGFFIILLAFAFLLSNLLSLVISFCFIPYMSYFQISPEEKALSALFGEEFEKYKSKVPRWL